MRLQRGFTLIELVIAVAVGSVIILGAWSFYVGMIRASMISTTQIDMQRRASLIQQEFTRIIQGSDNILPGTCGPSSTAGRSLPVHVPAKRLVDTAESEKYFCYYFSGSPGNIVRCQFASPSSTACTAPGINLLLGDPVPYTIQATPTTCTIAPALSAAGFGVVGNYMARVCFTLQAVAGTTVLAGPIAFETKATIRN